MSEINEKTLKEISKNCKFLYKEAILMPEGKNLEEVLINLFKNVQNKNFKQDDILLLDGYNKSIDYIDIFDKNLNEESKSFLAIYKEKIDEIEKPDFKKLETFKKDISKKYKLITKTNENDKDTILTNYNIKQEIKINFQNLYMFIKTFLDSEDSFKYEEIINLETIENILNNEKNVIKHIEKDLMFYLFEFYNKNKKINHINGIMESIKDSNPKISKSLKFIISRYKELNDTITKKIKYKEDVDKQYYLLFDDIMSLFPYGLTDFIDKDYSKTKDGIYTKIQTAKTKQNKKPQTDEDKIEVLSIYYKEAFDKSIENIKNINYKETIKFNHSIIKYGLFNILFLIDFASEEEQLETINNFLNDIDNYSKNFKDNSFNQKFYENLKKIQDKVIKSEMYNNYNLNKDVVLNSLNNIFDNKEIKLVYYIDFIKLCNYLIFCNNEVYEQNNKEIDFSKLKEYNFISDVSNVNTLNYEININFNFYKEYYKTKLEEPLIQDNQGFENIKWDYKMSFGKHINKTLKELYDNNFKYIEWLDKENVCKGVLKEEIIKITNYHNNFMNTPIKKNENEINCVYDTKHINILLTISNNYLDIYQKAILTNNKYRYYNFNPSYILNFSRLSEIFVENYKSFNIYKKMIFELNLNIILNNYFNNILESHQNEKVSVNCINLLKMNSDLSDIIYDTISDISINLNSINKNICFNKQSFNFDNKINDVALSYRLNSSQLSLLENTEMKIKDDIENTYLIMCKFEISTRKFYVLEFLIENNIMKVGYNIHDFINFDVINTNIEKYKIKNVFFVINKKSSFSDEINNIQKEFYKNVDNGMFLFQTSDSKIYDKNIDKETFGMEYLDKIDSKDLQEIFDYNVSPIYSLNTFINMGGIKNDVINISKGNIYLVNNLQNLNENLIKLFYKVINLTHIKFTSKIDEGVIKNNNMRNLWNNSDSKKIVTINNRTYNFLLTKISSIFIGLKDGE